MGLGARHVILVQYMGEQNLFCLICFQRLPQQSVMSSIRNIQVVFLF